MSRKKPIEINIERNIRVNPSGVFHSEVVRSGNGAVIKSYKRFIGKKVIVIVDEHIIKGKRNKESRELGDCLELNSNAC